MKNFRDFRGFRDFDGFKAEQLSSWRKGRPVVLVVEENISWPNNNFDTSNVISFVTVRRGQGRFRSLDLPFPLKEQKNQTDFIKNVPSFFIIIPIGKPHVSTSVVLIL